MENNALLDLSPAQLRRAAELKERIDGLNDELGRLLGGSNVGNGFRAGSTAGGDKVGNGRATSGRRKMSAAGRARIAAAARARWAKVKAGGGSTLSGTSGGNTSSNGRKKRTMSPAARAKIAAAAKARWAKVRAAKGK